MVNACRQFLRGKVKEGSKRWDLLVQVAGGADKIGEYCEDLLGDDG